MREARWKGHSTSLATLSYFLTVLFSFLSLTSQVVDAEQLARITIEAVQGNPYDTVLGTVSGVHFEQVSVVVFVRTDQWYVQPYEDDRAYQAISPDGTYTTWIRDWRQISAFVIRKGFDALSAQKPHKPFPLSIDGIDVLALAAYPSLQFSGYEWAIKSGDLLGPGNNYFSANNQNVWVDTLGRLHLRISQRDGRWYCAEVYMLKPFGYGVYTFFVSSRVDQLDKNVVGSLFLYQDDEHELDIEFSSWGVEGGPNAQFVVQPWQLLGHREQFDLSLSQDQSTHIIRWQPGFVLFQSASGHERDPAREEILHRWIYSGADVPVTGDELTIHLNLWLLEGQAPSDGQEAEMVVHGVQWTPKFNGGEKIVPSLLLLLTS